MSTFHKFLGFESSFSEAKLVFMGLPFDGTASFRAGSRFAPDSVRYFSQALETYSPYQNKDVADTPICDIGNLDVPFGNTEKSLAMMKDKADELLKKGKKVIACGGEHLITYPLLQSYQKKYPDLHLIHIDAHTDLREQYLGEELSHATVMRLAAKIMPAKNIYQYGIRSGEKHEFEWAKANTHFYPFTLSALKNCNIASSVPVYLTLDVDVLDPSCFPGTGTPEPGGVSFQELLEALLSLKKLQIVGADVVELAPDYDYGGISSITAAKLIREIALLFP